MLQPLHVSVSVIKNNLEQNDYATLAANLDENFKLLRDEQGAPIPYEFCKDVINTLHEIINNISGKENTNDLIKALFRSLRNYVTNREVQNYIVNDAKFLYSVKKFMVSGNHDSIPIIQFLINLVILNEMGSNRVYEIFSEEILALFTEDKCIYEASALLYYISLYHKLEDFDFSFYLRLLELYESLTKVEFLHFLLEQFVSYDKFWDFYNEFNLQHRIIILGVIRDKQIKDNKIELSENGIKVIIRKFINSGNIIFQTITTSENNLYPYEVSQLLSILSSLCCNEYHLLLLQKDKDLLIISGVLLINIHRLGKESENCFTSIQKLAEIREPPDNIRQHPAFGFKANLIRIIGNLCWKNSMMQDLVREAELIPVILDCCNMDARNPLIMQWVILAIRNLCENNLKNQEIIAGMHQQGTVSSSTLEEMGLTLHSDSDNSLKVIPLDALKK